MTTAIRTYLAWGTGVGIEIAGPDLKVTVSKVRPGGPRILGELDITNFREQAAAEWGEEYASFLRKSGAGYLAATVLLPREDVIVREVAMPGVADRNLADALKFQIDSLHPWPDDEAVYAFARVGKTDTVVVGITRRSVVDEYTTLFAEAGVKIARFTFSAASIWSAVRLYTLPPDGFLAYSQNGSLELYGESAARPMFSASFDQQPDRAVAFALSELRLLPESEPVTLESLLPKPVAAPAETALARTALPYAAALSGACPWLSLDLNLLPEDKRQGSSRAIFIPSVVLGSLIAITAIMLLISDSLANRRYLATLETEIRALTPVAMRAQMLDRSIVDTRARTEALDAFRQRSRDDMDALNELTRIVAPPGFLTSLNMTRQEVDMTGRVDQAAGLLKALDSSGRFQNSQFTMPLSRADNGEQFSVKAQRKGAP